VVISATGKRPALDGGSGVGLPNAAVRRHRSVLRSEQFLPRLDVRQIRVDSLDRGPLLPKLVLERLDPCPPCGLPRPFADIAGLVLAPGAAQHPVEPSPIRGHPGAGGTGIPPDCPQNGIHRLFPQRSSLRVVGIDRRHQETGTRCSGHLGKPRDHDHVPVDEIPLRRYPRVENPRRFQGRLEPRALVIGQPRREIGHFP